MSKTTNGVNNINNHSHLMLRGGRLTKWQGRVASIAPHMADLGSTVSVAALGMVLAIGGSMLTAGGAQAGTCSPGPAVTCSGPADPATDTTIVITSAPTITTDAGFGIDTSTNGGAALVIDGFGGTTFIDNNNSTITGATDGIYASNFTSGALSITTNGSVTGVTNTGIDAWNTASGTDLSISAVDVSGGNTGILAVNNGAGATSVTSTGLVAGTTGTGINVVNTVAGTDITVDATDVAGAGNGIYAVNRGIGALSVTSTGAVTGAANNGIVAGIVNAGSTGDVTVNTGDVTGDRYGIYAINLGTGAVSVTSTGLVTGATEDGIQAFNTAASTGDLTVNAVDVTGYYDGIDASNSGTGALGVTSTGTVTGTIDAGISAHNYAGTDLTVNAADVTGGNTGILAVNYGTGATSVTSTGVVTGTYGDGIQAYNTAASTGDLTVNAVDVTGYDDGIDANNYGTGALAVTTTGTVTGTMDTGIYAYNGAAGTDLTINAVDVTGGIDGILAFNNGTGALSLNTTGAVTGSTSYGILAFNGPTGTDLSVNAADVTGDTYGILANNQGGGALSVTSTGTTTGATGSGIFAYNGAASTDLTVDAVDVDGGVNGILAANFGTGATTVTSTGVVTGATGDGIQAYNTAASTGDLTVNAVDATGDDDGIDANNYGSGALVVNATGAVTGTNGDSIYAYNSAAGTDLTINAADTTGAITGINAGNYGTGALSVTSSGTSTGAIAGILAINNSAGTDLIVDANDTSGGLAGIAAGNYGTGELLVTSTGTATSVNGAGILADNSAAGTDLTVNAFNATGGMNGIDTANYGTGETNITTTGLVQGTNNAIYAYSAGQPITITNTGTLQNTSGLTSDSAVTAFGGPVHIINNNNFTGTVTLGPDDDVFTNNGTWNSIDGINDFGGGADSLVNAAAGKIVGGTDAALVETTTFDNLETLTNAGVITMVDGGMGDIVQTSGTASFAAGSTLAVDAGGAGLSDQFIAAGAVTLNGGSLNVNFVGANPTLGTRYTVLKGSSVAGTFNYADQYLTAFLGLRDGYTPTSAYVEYGQLRTLASVGLTPNQIATAGGADGLALTSPIKWALLNLPDEATARNAFDQLSGEIHPSARTAIIEDSRLPRNAVLGRLSDGTPGGAIWGQAFGNWGTSDGDRNAAKLDRDTLGFMIGADLGLGENVTLGLAGGYLDTDLALDARNSTGSAKTIHGLVYVGGRFGGFGVKAGLGYAKADIDTTRTVAFPGFSDVLHADYDGTIMQAFAEAGYKLPLGGGNVEPFANLVTLRAKTDGFIESGGLAALTVAKRSENSTFSTAGLRFETAPDESFSVRGMIGWQHGFGKLDPVGTHSFAGGTPFTILGAAQSRDGGVANIEARFNLSSNVSLSVAYDGVLGDAGQDHAVKGGLKIAF